MSENPFEIRIAENEVMDCWDIQLNVGGCKSEDEAKAMADALAGWLTEESGWKARVQ